MKSYLMGDPLKQKTYLGPLARSDLRDNVHQQIHDFLEKGTILAAEGEIPESKGASIILLYCYQE